MLNLLKEAKNELGVIRFVVENPDIIDFITEHALRLKKQGYKYCPFRALWESARLHGMGRRKPGEKWAINNDYSAGVSRYIQAKVPELKGFFWTRGGN